jgi:4-hydroxythreonine-4-phosphate dehydrogenase
VSGGKILALTQGDPAGIGPELTLKAWAMRGEGVPPFLALADPDLLARTAARLGLRVPIERAEPETAAGIFPRALPVLPLAQVAGAGEVEPGRPSAATAPGTIAAIEGAVALVRAGRAAAVVTNPIAKHVLAAAGFPHPGHTEFLAALAAEGGETPRPVMMLWSETLAVVPITVHIPLRQVPEALTEELVVETARIVAGDLAARFGLARPRLVVAGLNPHAGEAGTIGTEDRDVLAPAVARLVAEGLDVTGPLSADTLFHPRARETYDVALCPTHDQALIPIKTLAFDEGVNVTLGLPFVRTSPDHGTAFDIAGRGIARPDSLVAALRLAARLAGR